MTRCVKCEVLETRNGFTIHREEDKKIDFFTDKPTGRAYVFYTVNDEERGLLESFKTLREARKYADDLYL